MNVGRAIGLCVFLNVILLCRGNSIIQFEYPADKGKNSSQKSAENKEPNSMPTRCEAGELLYIGEQDDALFCDCLPGFVYYPPKKQCYRAFTKGPCNENEYIIFERNSDIPDCIPNPCKLENHVPYNNGCYELDTAGPCPSPETSNVIGVNEKTLEIICTNSNADNIGSRLEEEFDSFSSPSSSYPISTFHNKRACFRGGRRWIKRQCPQQKHSLVFI